jgi:hypothetical protein
LKSPVPFTVSGSKFTSNYAASGHGGGCTFVVAAGVQNDLWRLTDSLTSDDYGRCRQFVWVRSKSLL